MNAGAEVQDRGDTPKAGDILAGKYRVEQVLGVGGMGVVVRAMHMDLDQRVAIKWMHQEVAAVPEFFERFLREGRAAAKLRSEHVVRVIDVSRFQGGRPYMVMEYLEGKDLSEVLEAQGPLPIEQAVDFVLQAMEAIAEAHSQGIVHRDLKPSNLFMTKAADGEPLVKVLDFGISKVTQGAENKNMTATRTMLGSPAYMSPEQIRSAKNVDGRTDIWALGVILYELLTTKPPFDADSLPGLVAAITADTAVPLRERRPDVPEGLERVVHRCLAKSVDERYQDVAELARDLARFGKRHASEQARRIAVILGKNPDAVPESDVRTTSAESSGGTFDKTESTFGITVPENRLSGKALAVGGALVLLLLGGGGLLYWFAGAHGDQDVQQSAAASVATPSASAAVPAVPDTTSAVPSSEEEDAGSQGQADAGGDLDAGDQTDAGKDVGSPSRKGVRTVGAATKVTRPPRRPASKWHGRKKQPSKPAPKVKVDKPQEPAIDLTERK